MARKELSQDELLRIRSAADYVREKAVLEEAEAVMAVQAASPDKPASAGGGSAGSLVGADQGVSARYILAVTPANAQALKAGRPAAQVTLTISALREMIERIAQEHGGDHVSSDADLKSDHYLCAFETADAACNTATGIIFALESFNQHDNALGDPLILRAAVSAPVPPPAAPPSIGRPAANPAPVAGVPAADDPFRAAKDLLAQAGDNDVLITVAAFDALEEKGAYDRVQIGGETGISVYRFNPQIAANMARSQEQTEAIVDPVSGVSASKLEPNSIIWVNRSGLFSEAAVDRTESLPNGDVRLDLSLPNGNHTRLHIKSSVQLCTSQERAVAIGVRKYKTLPGIETFLDAKIQRAAVSKAPARTGAEIIGFVAVVLGLLGLIYYIVAG